MSFTILLSYRSLNNLHSTSPSKSQLNIENKCHNEHPTHTTVKPLITIMPLTNVKPEDYHRLLEEKTARITKQFSQFNTPRLEVYPSSKTHFRMRAEFRVWHQDDECFYAMFKKEAPKTPCRINSFSIGSLRINELMPLLMGDINNSEILKNRLFQIEFLTTLTGQALVTLIYHKALEEQWQHAATLLQNKYEVRIIGRSKKQRLVLECDYVTEEINVNSQKFLFQQVENGFTQPNAGINQKMLEWTLDNSSDNGGDLLELYCGNGNFATVLAQNFNKVLCTEISKTSVKSAIVNFDLNNVRNVKIARMSSEEFTSALNGERLFRRLREIDLDDYSFSTVLVDPPRAGLDQQTEKLLGRFDNIIYISCNPQTLFNNLLNMTETHSIDRMALFDQFPYTDHIECGVILSRR